MTPLTAEENSLNSDIMPTRFQKLRKLLTVRPNRSSRARKHRFVTTDPILQPQSQLCALPIELVECIAAELELADLCSLRLTCNKIYQRTLHYFGFTYFTSIGTNLSPTSVQKLEQISRHPHLGRYVQTLFLMGATNIGGGYSWNRNPSGSLLFPHPGVQTLQDAILNMANCRSFYVFKEHHTKYIPELDCLEPSDAVAIFLYIIAETSLPVKSFTADFSGWGRGELDARRLHLSTYQKPEFRSTWAQLQELSLHNVILFRNLNWMLDLFLKASSLQKLSLSCCFKEIKSFIDQVLSYKKLTRLQGLDLYAGHIEGDSFFKLFSRFGDSLRVLRLSHFSLGPKTLRSTGPWKLVFGFLKRELLVLKTISLYILTQYGNGTQFRQFVIFPALSKNPSVSGLAGGRFTITVKARRHGPNWIPGVSYSGPRMSEAFDKLIESTEYI